MRYLSPVLIAVLLAGCATGFADMYIERRPGMSEREKDAVREMYVYPGLHRTHAKAALGEPHRINTTTTEHGEREQWVYRLSSGSAAYVYVEDDTVRSIQERGYEVTE